MVPHHPVKAVPSGVFGRTTINHHGFCRGLRKSSLRLGFLVNKGFALYVWRLVTILTLRTFDVKNLVCRIFARSRTPKCAKLVLGASAVHVRSRWCSHFFGVGPPKNEKRAILREKGAYCELASSLSPHPLMIKCIE